MHESEHRPGERLTWSEIERYFPAPAMSFRDSATYPLSPLIDVVNEAHFITSELARTLIRLGQLLREVELL